MQARPAQRGVHTARVPRLKRMLSTALAAALAGLAALVVQPPPPAAAIDEAEAAKGPPVSVALFVSSRTDLCFDNGYLAATTELVNRARDQLNAKGGIAGRPVAIRILDDARDDKRAIDNMRTALADPTTVAMIGLSGSNRGKAVFDALGKEIGASGIAFISDLSVSSIFAGQQNVYTTRASQDEVRAPVMAEFTRAIGYQRPAYLGLSDAVFSTALGDSLKKQHGDAVLVSDQRLQANEGSIAPDVIADAVRELKSKDADILYIGAGSRTSPDVIKALVAGAFTPALFVVGRINALPEELTRTYPNAIYQLTWDDLPEVYNNRVRRQIAIDDPATWVFEGAKVDAAPGWRNGECKARPERDEPDPLTPENLRAINTGAQNADMLGLLAAAAARLPRGSDIAEIRRGILAAIGRDFAAGQGAYKGAFENWSFDPRSRTATRMPFIVILPQGLGRTQLAPVQFIRARDGSLRQTSTLYADIDLIKADRINDNEQSFFAEFYLSLRAGDVASIDRIEFANGYIDPVSGKRQITVETIHAGGASPSYPASMKIYKIFGRFLYQPRLEKYPLDTQLFTIDLQPKSGELAFIVQPPPLALRDQNAETDGWDQMVQYVGTEQDFVPVVDAFTHEPSVVPFYKASYAWLLKRQTTDYIMRVVVPLGFILMVAYLSIFIPRSNFEAIVTIQVTALLSAVALYLALPSLESDTATLSDRMFVFVYMLVAVMIGISIARVNQLIASRKWIVLSLDAIHVLGIPIIVAIAAAYVWGLSLAG